MGLGMGMESLLGKGHMVFPEDFFMSCIRWTTSHSILHKATG